MVGVHETGRRLAGGFTAAKIQAPFLAVLVVLTLLVCHAALGGTNRLALAPAHQLSGVAGNSIDQFVESSGTHTYYYVAALCSLLLGYFASLFFGGARRRSRPAFLHDARRHFSLKTFYDGACHTRPFLQVFRL